MKKWKSIDWQIKVIFYVLLGVFLIAVIPLFIMSFYSFMCADDYGFAKNPVEVWKESHSLFKLMVSQFAPVKSNYMSWQGTYFSEWFNRVLIGMCGETAYYVGTFISLGGLIAAELFTFMTVLVKGLDADKYCAGIVSMGCVLMQIWFTPVPVEAYYWFCGAIVYTFIYALCWLLIGILFLLCRGVTGRKKLIIFETIIVLLSISIGGSNYVTGLVMVVVYAFFVMGTFLLRNRNKYLMLANMVIYLIAFGFNALAPGNMARQNTTGLERNSAVESIMLSFKEALEYIMVNMWLPNVIVALLLVPFFIRIVKRKQNVFRFPALISFLSFCLFAAHFTPNLYALGFTGAGRVLNLYRFSFYFLLYANELYWIGWLSYRHSEKYKAILSENAESNEAFQKESWLLPSCIFGGVVLCISMYFFGGKTITSVSAISDLCTGVAQQYHAEQEERLALYENPSIKEVYVTPYTNAPYLLFFKDIDDTEDAWLNRMVAVYYDKDKVAYVKE
ncbi:MAG: hypothetical protein E7299_07220 [Lachnospiraceae bacterium]|nr:hypothetical protein [Lachnospiraceae bacterium]